MGVKGKTIVDDLKTVMKQRGELKRAGSAHIRLT